MRMDINMLVTGVGSIPQEDKGEAHLRRDQTKLRDALDKLNGLLNKIIEKEIVDERKFNLEKQKIEKKKEMKKKPPLAFYASSAEKEYTILNK